MKTFFHRHIRAAAVLGFVMALAAPTRAAFITNGNFATGDFTGWTLSNLQSRSIVDVDSGVLAAELTTATATTESLSQSLMNLVAGQKYTLSFQLATDTSQPNLISATLAGNTLLGPTDLTTALDVYTTYTYVFTAATATDKLSFNYSDAAGYDYLTNVTVTANAASAVPEPSAIVSTSLGLALLIGFVGFKQLRSKKLRFALVPATC